MQESAIRSKCQLPAQARAVLRGPYSIGLQQPEGTLPPKHMLGRLLSLDMREKVG